MEVEILFLLAIVGLIFYGSYELLIGFHLENSQKDMGLNYGIKGFLYLWAVVISIYIVVFKQGQDIERFILLYIAAIEAISCLKERKKIINNLEDVKHNRKFFVAKIICGCSGVVIVLIVIPYFISKLIGSFNSDTSWIDFWGGYLGAIIGGIITLVVMYYTIKDGKENLSKTMQFEKQKITIERKRVFNDELLQQLVKYQTGLQGINSEIRGRNIQDNFMERVRTCDMLSKILHIKLESKKDDINYNYVGEMINTLEQIAESFNDLVDLKNKELDGKEISGLIELQKKVDDNIEKLIDAIETYYLMNEQNELL